MAQDYGISGLETDFHLNCGLSRIARITGREGGSGGREVIFRAYSPLYVHIL